MVSRIQILSLVGVFYSLVPTVTAEDITVTSLDSSGAGTLRQAIADSGDGDTIFFAPPLAGGTISLGGSELLIENDITINASSPQGGIGVSGSGISRVFKISAGASATLVGLTITRGSTRTQFPDQDGGGILVNGTLALRHCTVSGNYIFWPGRGGGIAVAGSGRLTIEDCEVSDNEIEGGSIQFGSGGGIFSDGAEVTILRSTISDNLAGAGSPGASGGGIYNRSGILNVSSSRVSGNRAGSGIYDFGSGNGSSGGDGGGIYSSGGTLVIDRTTISGNSSGGGVESTGLGDGGDGGDGGGIYISSGNVTISNSTVSDNLAQRGGGSLKASSGRGGSGAGIAVFGRLLDLAITNSTISGNRARSGTGFGGNGNGLFFSAERNNFEGTMVLNHAPLKWTPSNSGIVTLATRVTFLRL